MFPFNFKYNHRSFTSFAEIFFEDCQVRYRISVNNGPLFTILPSGIPGPGNKIIWVQSNKPGEIIQPHDFVQAVGEGIEEGIIKPQGWLPRYESKDVVAEIDLRGRFIMMACDIEWTLLNIMMHCAPDPLNQARRYNSKEMRMHNKIEATIADLKTYRPILYEEYKDELDKLWEFKEVRNDLAHKKLLFEGNDFINFKFLFIQNNEDGNEQLYYKHYTIEYFKAVLQKFMDLNITMVALLKKLKDDINL